MWWLMVAQCNLKMEKKTYRIRLVLMRMSNTSGARLKNLSILSGLKETTILSQTMPADEVSLFISLYSITLDDYNSLLHMTFN